MEGLTDEVRQFVAGFVDGDGCIEIPKPNDNQSSYPARVVVDQSRDEGVPEELSYIQRFYGGEITSRPGRKENWRRHWELHINAGAEKILEDLAEFAISKRAQAQIALEYHRYVGSRKEIAGEYRERMAKKKTSSDFVVLINRMTPAYMAGLFAADGTVGLYASGDKSWRVISNLRSRKMQLLHAYLMMVGEGYTRKGILHFGPAATTKLYSIIGPHLIGAKVPQFQRALQYRELQSKMKNKKRTQQDIEETQKIMDEIKRMKKR